MAGLVRQECLACTHSPRPVCDGSGVRLLREPDGAVVDVQLCVRWPASWDEPVAYWDALAQHGTDRVPVPTVPDKIWPAVQAELAQAPRLPSDGTTAEGQEPTYREAGPARALRLVLLVIAVALVLAVVLVVRS